MSEYRNRLAKVSQAAAGSRRRPAASFALLALLLLPTVVSVGCSVSSSSLPELPPVSLFSLMARDLPPAFQGSAYSQALSTSGGPVTGVSLVSCSVIGGTFPSTLSIRVNPTNRSQCEVFATLIPTGAGSPLGTFTFTVQATDATSVNDTENYQVTIRQGFNLDATFSFAGADGTQGRPYNISISATFPGNSGPLTNCSATGLPTGLNIGLGPGGTSCVITGSPTVSGTFSVRITATDSAANTRTFPDPSVAALTLVINAPLVMDPFTLTNGTVGRAFSFTVTTTGGELPLTICSAPALPAGLSVAPDAGARNCVISGTPTVTFGPTNVTVSATDTTTTSTTQATVNQSSSLTVNPVLDITSLTLTNGTVGRAFSQSLTRAGGQTPFTWSNPGGMAGACAGLSVSAAGLVSGTPTTAGTCTFTARIDDTATSTTAAGFDQDTITILINPVLTVTTTSFENGTVGRAFSGTLASTGGQTAFTWSSADIGSDPECAGLTVNAGGTVTGTPTTAGVCTFTARVDDTATASTSAGFDTELVSLTLNSVLTVTTTTLSNGRVGSPFSEALTRTGGQTPFAWSSANLAADPECGGLALSAAGVLSGTPTTAGVCTFTARVDDTATATTLAGFDTEIVSLTISAGLTITSTTLTNGTVGRVFSEALTLTGGNAPFTWTSADIGADPECAGLAVTAATGLVTGTPTTAGTCTFTARVDDTATVSTPSAFDTETVTILINAVLTVTTTSFENGTVGRAFSATLAFTGGQPVYTASSADIGADPQCAGLTVNSNATVTGTPTTAGVCTFTARIDDTATTSTAAGFDTETVTININAVLTVTTTTLSNGTVGSSFTESLASTGGQAVVLTWSSADIGSDPECAGLSVSTGGVVSGTPTTTGVCTFTARVDDTATTTTAAGFDTELVSLTINAALTISIGPGLFDGVEQRGYNLSLTNTGGNAPFTWSEVAGATLANDADCAGLSLAANGTLSGTPTAAGPVTCSFTARVDDTATASTPATFTTQAMTITIQPPLLATLAQTGNATPNVSLFDGVFGRTYGVIGATPTWTASGGLGGYKWCIFAGAAPAGMSGITTNCAVPDAAGGVTLTAPVALAATGLFNFTVRLVDTGNAAVASGFDNDSTALNVNAALTVTENVGTRLVNAITLPNGVDSRPYGPSLADPTRSNAIFTASGGVITGLTYTRTVTNIAPAFPATFACALSGNTQVLCNSGGNALPAGSAAGGPYTFDVVVSDDGNAAVPFGTVTLNNTLNVQPVLALARNMAPPDAVTGRTYGQSPRTPITYTASGGLSAGGVNFSVPANQATPGAGYPTGFACTPVALVLTCGSAGGVTGTDGLYTPIDVQVNDIANATTPSSGAVAGATPSDSTSLTVQPALTINDRTFDNGTVGRAFGGGTEGTVLVAFSGGLTGFSCSGTGTAITTTGLAVPAGPSGSNCTVTGSPTTATGSPFALTVTVTDTANASTPSGSDPTSALSVGVNPVLTITTVDADIPAATTGSPYVGFTFVNTGGQTPFTWSNPSGTPAVTLSTTDADCAGLFLTAAGAISGTATGTAGTTCTFTVRVDDTQNGTTAAGLDGPDTFNIQIVDALAVVPFTPVGDGTVSRAFQLLISVGGGDGTLRGQPNGCIVQAGTLPAGLSIFRGDGGAAGGTSNQCEISGTPTTAATSSGIVIRVSDRPGSTADSASFSITINAALSLAAFTLQDGTEGRAFGDGAGGPFQIAITGGKSPYTCDDPTASLPPGVVVAAVGSNCEISGTPGATAAPGPYTVNIRAQDTATGTTAAGSNSKTSAAININEPLTITEGATLPGAVEGRAYSRSLAFTGGESPFTWSEVLTTTLADDTDCAGLSLSAAGVLSGTPTATGPAVCTFTAQVDDTATTTTASGNTSLAFTLNIQAPLTVTTTTMPNARRTSVYVPTGPGVQLTVTGGTGAMTWSAVGGDGTSLNLADAQCAGLTLSAAGVVSGTPTNAASDFDCAFTARVDDAGSGGTAAGNDTQALTITVLNTYAYAAGNGTATIEVINIDGNTAVASISTGGAPPDQVAVAPNGRYVYFTSPTTDELIILDARNNSVVGGAALDISADCTTPTGIAATFVPTIGERVYIVCAGDDAVAVLDADPASVNFNTIVNTIGGMSSGGGTPERIAFSPDGMLALVTVSGTDEVTILDTVNEVVDAGPNTFTTTCDTPMGVVFATDGLAAFVACQITRAVSKIDTDTTSGTYGTDVAQSGALGTTGAARADSIAITPDGLHLYVTLGGGGGGLPQLSRVAIAGLVVTNGFGVPCLAGGCFDTGQPSPLGIIIPPFGAGPWEVFVAMSGDASDSSGPTNVSPGVAIFVHAVTPATTEGTNNPIVFAAGTAARGIAFIPIPR